MQPQPQGVTVPSRRNAEDGKSRKQGERQHRKQRTGNRRHNSRLTETKTASQSTKQGRATAGRIKAKAEQETRTRQPNDRKPKTDDLKQLNPMVDRNINSGIKSR